MFIGVVGPSERHLIAFARRERIRYTDVEKMSFVELKKMHQKQPVYIKMPSNFLKRRALTTRLKNCTGQKMVCWLLVDDTADISSLTDFNIPYYYEGWSEIHLKYRLQWKHSMDELLEKMDGYRLPKKMMLGEHLRKVAECFDDPLMKTAGFLHDCAKPETLTFSNDNECRFSGHENASAYKSLFYTEGMQERDALFTAALIMWHMSSTMETFFCVKEMVGAEMYGKLEEFYKADDAN